MVSAGQQAGDRHRGRPRVVIVLDATRAGDTYRVEAPDRVLRMYGLLAAAWDQLDLTTIPPQHRARAQRLLETVSTELERSVSPALAGELRELVRPGEAVPSAAELRIEYSSLLGWASGLVVAMLDQLTAARDKPLSTAPGIGLRGSGTAPDFAHRTAHSSPAGHTQRSRSDPALG